MSKKEIQLNCGCHYSRQPKGRLKWFLCFEAKKLKREYEEDFLKRNFYDEHFFKKTLKR